MDICEKIKQNLATLDDQDKALFRPLAAYLFASYVYGANIKLCQKAACKYPVYAYWFAKDISEADIEYCQEYACKDPVYSYLFAQDVPGANIEYCRKACESSSYVYNAFCRMIVKKVLE